MSDIIFLRTLSRHEDLALLALRVVVGAFLIWGVWDNVLSPSRMAEFAGFLAKHGFPAPRVMAQVSVYAQLAVGVAFVVGLLTRWAGLICAINFIVAIVMVDRLQGVRGMFPSAALVLIGLYLAAHGAGRFALDNAIGAPARKKARRR